MSGRAQAMRLAATWRHNLALNSRRSFHDSRGSRLFGPDTALRAVRRRQWPMGSYALHSGAIVRTISFGSFGRSLPKLVVKFARVPAAFGGAMIAGLAYLQYQATQAGTYALGVFNDASTAAGAFGKTMFDGASSIAEQTQRGWARTKEEIQVPEWLSNIMVKGPETSNGGGGGGGGGGKGPDGKTAAAASAAALGLSQVGDDEERSQEEAAKDDQMMVLTKKMIEIRGILQQVGQSETLTLPSIVVIGSQSSGKSSVLESIVGHEFLPKGSNMVTRRPIELTLVNTPGATAEYGEFPALGLGKITDFSSIQRTLTDLNLAVSDSECVSDDPIQLRIYSPNVPDLSLIDLPGYIQVVGKDQPLELKQKITELCDRYIQPPNVILAISAADVDLANSTALRASRRVDPRGERTIGVVTKMDLVAPERGYDVLTDSKYPLRLGYVGVVSKVPHSAGIFSRGSGNITGAITKNEKAFFSAHPTEYGPDTHVVVGTSNLRKKLMQTLEQTMAASLQTTTDAIQTELDEAIYEFKVQYNERPLSAESYMAESLDAFKHSFKELSENFGKPQVREILKSELDQRVLDLLAQRYWNKPVEELREAIPEPDSLKDLPNADPQSPYWLRKLDASTSTLTKLGIGRLATTVVSQNIEAQVNRLLKQSSFATHPAGQQAIADAASEILSDRFYSTSDQVENCIKPYKYEIEVEDNEWAKARENTPKLLKQELQSCEDAYKRTELEVGGRRKLREVVSFIDKVRSGDVVVEGAGTSGAGGFSASLLAKGLEAVFLRDRADIIKMRLLATRSKQCANQKNKYYCPEIFLDVVADKLTSTAVLFLNVELLSEFYYNFPRELDTRLGKNLPPQDLERFAREDPRIARHLEVIRKKDLLELALEKIQDLRQLENRQKGRVAGGASTKKEKKAWGFF